MPGSDDPGFVTQSRYKMKKVILLYVLTILVSACNGESRLSWQPLKIVRLDSIKPIGLTFTADGLWLSDGDHNRLVLIDKEGHTVKTVDSLERPMHIDSQNGVIYVPLYGNDLIAKVSRSAVLALPVTDSLDAPAGVSIFKGEAAIADFYNHRILYSADGTSYESIGMEGKGEGEFYYPTDVQITSDKIWVADAYNNRVQVFDKKGNFLQVIGADQGFNAATGLYVSESELFVTDFENNRVLVFDHQGSLKQTITEGIEKPTDVLQKGDSLYIANYGSGDLSLYAQGE